MSIETFDIYCRNCIKKVKNMLNFNRKEKHMLNINFEFRKGIFFIRFIGDMNRENYQKKKSELKKLIIENKFKYIVLNTNYLRRIDLDGLNYLLEIYYITKDAESNLVICDNTNTIKKLIDNSIPNIKDELEVL